MALGKKVVVRTPGRDFRVAFSQFRAWALKKMMGWGGQSISCFGFSKGL